MFNESFGKTVAKEMLPKIETAIGINTIEGYKKLDEEYFVSITKQDGLVADLKGLYRNKITKRNYWSL